MVLFSEFGHFLCSAMSFFVSFLFLHLTKIYDISDHKHLIVEALSECRSYFPLTVN